MGVSVKRFLLWLRVLRAAQLAHQTRDLTELAHAAGFADSAHMSRSFVDLLGQPPSHTLNPDVLDVFVVDEEPGG